MKQNSIKEMMVTRQKSLVSMKTNKELMEDLILMQILLYMRTVEKEIDSNTEKYINTYIEYLESKERVTDRKKAIIKDSILEFDKLIIAYDTQWGNSLFEELQMYRYMLIHLDYKNISKSEMSIRYSAILHIIAIAYSKDEPVEEANKIYMEIVKEGLNKERVQNRDREFINNES